MRVLVFGATGQVARALARAKWPTETTLVALDREAADFSRPETLGAMVREHAPDAVVVAAAYTQVDRAESEEALATTINAVAPGEIARAAAAMSVPVLHISSDYVFDGEKDGFYAESDPVGPIGAYGRSKLAGEVAVREANPKHLILRTSWIYDAAGTNFLRSMLRLAETRDEVTIVADQRGCPTTASDIAGAIAHALPLLLRHDGKFGTYHTAGVDWTTWHGFAEAIFSELAERGLHRPRNKPIATADWPTPARRPKNSRLACEAFARDFNMRLRGFRSAMPEILDAILGSARQAPAKKGAA